MSETPRFPWERDEEVLKIETPEQTEISMVVADLGSRFGALFVDLLLLFLFVLFVWIVTSAAGLSFGEESGELLFGIFLAFQFLAIFFYFILFEYLWNGQTPGKRMSGIRVIQDSGRGLQLTSAILRNIVRLAELGLPPLLLVPFFTRGRRRLGDLLAGTYVVKVIKDAPPKESKGLLRPAVPGEEAHVFGFGEAQRRLMFEEDLDLLLYLEESLEGKRFSERKKSMQSVVERYILRFSMESRREEAQRKPDKFLRELGLELRKKYEDRAF